MGSRKHESWPGGQGLESVVTTSLLSAGSQWEELKRSWDLRTGENMAGGASHVLEKGLRTVGGQCPARVGKSVVENVNHVRWMWGG